MMKLKVPIRRKLNNQIANLGNHFANMDGFFSAVDEILAEHGLELANEDGTPFAAFFCGKQGSTIINLTKEGQILDNGLSFSWYELSQSIEIVAYIS